MKYVGFYINANSKMIMVSGKTKGELHERLRHTPHHVISKEKIKEWFLREFKPDIKAE